LVHKFEWAKIRHDCGGGFSKKILVYYRGVEIPAANPKEANIIWFSMQVDSEVENALGLTDQQYTDPKEPEPVRMNACFFP